jgi:hypothetical protein
MVSKNRKQNECNPRHRQEALEQAEKSRTHHAQTDLVDKWGWQVPVGHYRNLAGSHFEVIDLGDKPWQVGELS